MWDDFLATVKIKIYSYWNVNAIEDFNSNINTLIKIYSYWNVNRNEGGYYVKYDTLKSIHTEM